MLTFTRIFIGDILIKETGVTLKNCKLYEVFEETKKVGRFYSGNNFSFIELNELRVRINQNRHFFKRSNYSFFDQYTNELLGGFHIPNDQNMGNTKSNLYLSGGETYEWEQDNKHRRILKRETWSLYRFNLLSPAHSIVYYGKMIPDTTSNGINAIQSFDGEIQTTDDKLLLPIFAGIYIMEEKFRRIEELLD